MFDVTVWRDATGFSTAHETALIYYLFCWCDIVTCTNDKNMVFKNEIQTQTHDEWIARESYELIRHRKLYSFLLHNFHVHGGAYLFFLLYSFRIKINGIVNSQLKWMEQIVLFGNKSHRAATLCWAWMAYENAKR